MLKVTSAGATYSKCAVILSSVFFLLMFIFEIDSASRGGAEREGDTESEAGSRLRAVSTEPDARLEPPNWGIMT